MSEYRFHKKCEIQRSERTGGCIAHMKFTLSDRNDEDVVACLIVRQRIRPGLPADQLENLTHGHAVYVENQLRQVVEDRELFENAEL